MIVSELRENRREVWICLGDEGEQHPVLGLMVASQSLTCSQAVREEVCAELGIAGKAQAST